MNIKNYWKKFQDNFNLNGARKELFWKSQLTVISENDLDLDSTETTISTPFIIYRCIFAFYFILTLLITVGCAGDDKRPYWLIFLTNWTYTVQTIYAILSLCVLIRQKWIIQRDGKVNNNTSIFVGASQLPLGEKVVWILFNVTNAIPYGVTFVFWTILYPSIREAWLGSATPCQMLSNQFAHSFNSVMALLDLFVVAIPIRITHFVFGVAYVFIYLLFSVLYEVAGATYPYGFDYIYPPLNWKHSPGKAAAFGITSLFVFALCHFLFAFGLVKARTVLVRKISQLMGKYSYRLDVC